MITFMQLLLFHLYSLPFVLQQLHGDLYLLLLSFNIFFLSFFLIFYFFFMFLPHSAFKFSWPKRVAALAGCFGRLVNALHFILFLVFVVCHNKKGEFLYFAISFYGFRVWRRRRLLSLCLCALPCPSPYLSHIQVPQPRSYPALSLDSA